MPSRQVDKLIQRSGRDLAVKSTEGRVWVGLSWDRKSGERRGLGWGRMLLPHSRHFPICFLLQAAHSILPLVLGPSCHVPSPFVLRRFLLLEPSSNTTNSRNPSSHNSNDRFTRMFPPEFGEVNILCILLLYSPDLENVFSTLQGLTLISVSK